MKTITFFSLVLAFLVLFSKTAVSAFQALTADWELETDSWPLPRNVQQSVDLFDLKPAYASRDYDFSLLEGLSPRRDDPVGVMWAFDVHQMLPFLRQFHPGATVALSGQRGAYACLRAVSSAYYEIVFQFHADFDLQTAVSIEESLPMREQLQEEILDTQVQKLHTQMQKLPEEILDTLHVQLPELQEAIRLQKLPEEIQDIQDTEAVAALRELTATLEALSGNLDTRLDELKTTITVLEELASNFDAKFDELEQQLTETFDARLDELEQQLTETFDARLDELEQQLTETFDARLETLKEALRAQADTLTRRLNTLIEVEHLKGTPTYNEGIYLRPKRLRGRLLGKYGRGFGGLDEIVAFSLECPTDSLNATLVIYGDMEPVSMSRMELNSGTFDRDSMPSWTDAITVEQAHDALDALYLRFVPRKPRLENPVPRMR